MNIDPWWLLVIPVLFGLGWFAARLEGRAESAALPDAYFRGLNFLLNEQPDKAIDAFVEVVRVDPETIELHFALGNLFRRRGETDRAIRVHQNLADRSDLSVEQREHALFALGQDFLKAGLLDRAEDVFNRLAASGYRAAAMHHRLQIAQMVRDWPQAIELAQRLQADVGENRAKEIAQFHCERAAPQLEAARVGGEGAREAGLAAREAIERAIEADPSHPRPRLMRGQLAAIVDDADEAIASWRRVLDRSPAHAGLVAVQWLDVHRRAGRLDEGLQALESIPAADRPVDVLLAVFDARAERDGRAAAIAWLEAALRDTPSLLGLERLVAARLAEATDGERGEYELTLSLVQRQVRRLSRFVCGNCGFKARAFYWQCPGCAQWDTYAPRRGEELDNA